MLQHINEDQDYLHVDSETGEVVGFVVRGFSSDPAILRWLDGWMAE